MATINGTIFIQFDTDADEVTQAQFDAFKSRVEGNISTVLAATIEEFAADTGCGEAITMHSITDSEWSCSSDSGDIE